MSWNIDCVVVGPIQCNCYVIVEEQSRKAYLIDPGAESKELMQHLAKRKLDLQAILITHAHIDHVGGIEEVIGKFPVKAYYHQGDSFLYQNLAMQAELFGVTPAHLMAAQPASGEAALQHDREFPLDGGRIRVIHTPGHTPGSVCFHASGDGSLLFSGDTLFAGSIGRTDLWGGDFDQIIDSIKARLLTLDEATQVYPGHGPATTIGEERRDNPFLT